MTRTVMLTLFWFGGIAHAQAPGCQPTAAALPGIDGVAGDYARAVLLLADYGGVISGRPVQASDVCRIGPWSSAPDPTPATPGRMVRVAPVMLQTAYNSAYPRGHSTGALRPGRGVSTVVSAGLLTQLGPLRVSLRPVVTYEQNRDFAYPRGAGSEYAHPWIGGIDWPMRPGGSAAWNADPGQSFARLDLRGVAFGLSTENLWWGPAMRNALILGNEAPGFPHVFLGNGAGWRTPVGRIRAELFWGRLSTSAHADTGAYSRRTFFTGLHATFEPRGVPGLTFGASRTYQQPFPPSKATARDFFPFLESPLKRDLGTPENPSGNDPDDQIAGVFARYAVPRSGFEAYVEWARMDHAADMEDFWAEPDHTHAYTVGFQQLVANGERWYRLRGEYTSLNTYRPAGRPMGSWYSHSVIRKGHTHYGQLLGAGIGPQSTAAFVGGDVFVPSGRHGVFIERVRHAETHFYRVVRPVNPDARDEEWSVGTEHYVGFGAVSVLAGITVSRRRNRHFHECNARPGACESSPGTELNWHVPIGLSWTPR